MADPLSTILSQLANLASFKSSLRLLIICASIIFSWVYIQPLLLPFNIQNELLLTLLTVIGFSLGAILSSMFFATFDSLTKVVKRKIEKNKEKIELEKEESKKIEKKIRDNDLLRESFDDYSPQAKAILLTLLKKDSTIRSFDSPFDPHNAAFLGLLENKIVIPLNVIDKSKTFCSLNPTYKDTVKEIFDIKHKNEVNELIEAHFDGFDTLISKFKDDLNHKDYVFEIENNVYINRYSFTPVIRFEVYEEDEFHEDVNIQFYIEDYHLEHLSEKLQCELRDYILGKHDPEKGL